LPIGLAVDAAIGAYMGQCAHYEIDETFINQVCSKIAPCSSVSFLLSSGSVVDKVSEAIKSQQFEIIQSNQSKKQEEKLRGEFGEQRSV
jgi:uncharacterized membrane protein